MKKDDTQLGAKRMKWGERFTHTKSNENKRETKKALKQKNNIKKETWFGGFWTCVFFFAKHT